MAEPISITAVCAAASTATATGTMAGAASAGAAGSTGVSTAAGATTPAAGLGVGAGTGGLAAPVVPAAGNAPATAAATPLAQSWYLGDIQFIEFEPVDIKGEVETAQSTSAERALATEKVSHPAEQTQSPERATPGPTMESRATAREPVIKPADPQVTPAKPAERKPTSQSVEACREKGLLDEGRHIPKGETPNPLDPHEQEKQALNDLLGRFSSLPEEAQKRVIERVRIWEWHDKEKYPDKTDVIGEYGRGPRHLYEKERERQIRKREFEAQMRIGENIANNPVAGSVSLYVEMETGDAEKGADAGEPFQALTALGGEGGKPTRRQARTPSRPPRTSRSRTSPPRSSASAKGKGTPTRKPPPRKSAPPPPKLTEADRYYQKEVQRLRQAMPHPRAQNSTTLAIIVVEKGGKREVLLVSSLAKLPPAVEKAAGNRYRYVRGTRNRPGNPKDKNDPNYTSYHHAEHAGISAALSSGYKIIAVYPSRPACPHCGGFRDMGFTVIDP